MGLKHTLLKFNMEHHGTWKWCFFFPKGISKLPGADDFRFHVKFQGCICWFISLCWWRWSYFDEHIFQWVGSTTTYKVGRLSRSLEIELYHVITPLNGRNSNGLHWGCFTPILCGWLWLGDGFKCCFFSPENWGRSMNPIFTCIFFSMGCEITPPI